MSDVTLLTDHAGKLKLRTTASLFCYVGFVLAALTMAFKQYGLTDPVTLISLGLVVLAFVALPRDYKPVHLMTKDWDEIAVPHLSQIEQLQKLGFALRVIYGVGALVLIGVLPRMIG